jgi:hypothetical protein
MSAKIAAVCDKVNSEIKGKNIEDEEFPRMVFLPLAFGPHADLLSPGG